jgi:uncharacterized 2Fe-2S/4Fe-4S cluster protein (DUF4445 family)
LPVTADDQRSLSAAEIAAGWRLACRVVAETDLKLELAQWEACILSDDASFAFHPRPGLGIAVDVGTTTLVAQLVDLSTGAVLGVRAALNNQARHGGDVMSRIDFAITPDGGQILRDLIRGQIGGMIDELLASAAGHAEALQDVALVGNTVMHHLFCGISVRPLAHYPFEPEQDGAQLFDAPSLGWKLPCRARFLPCLGGFVGSDILAGVLATGLHERDELAGLVDLGTNGEIVIGNRQRLLCASTAAGPAFEGARISAGMRAATGAIAEVTRANGSLRCKILGNGPARGICGSGLVDAVAVGLEVGRIESNGKFSQPGPLLLSDPVALTQRDIRELQLAKGAIAAGFRILLEQWGARPEDLSRLYLAGAFGNYVNRASARRIGLLKLPSERVEPAGNTALRGAKLALFAAAFSSGDYADLRARVRHVPLSDDPRFQEIFVDEMVFPDPE